MIAIFKFNVVLRHIQEKFLFVRKHFEVMLAEATNIARATNIAVVVQIKLHKVL